MTLTAKQRHALAVIAATGFDGATQTLLTAHGFSIRTIAALVKRGLVTIAREKVRTGGKWIDAACGSRTRGETLSRPAKLSAKARHPRSRLGAYLFS